MIWKRNSKPSPAAPPESTPPREAVSLSPPIDPERELDSALDTIGGILRAIGRYAFDLPESEAKATTETCERWATHLILRTPAPDGRWTEGDPRPTTVRREWVTALHYLTNLRKNELGYITKTLGDLRQTVWAFVHGLNQALTGEGEANVQVKAQLARLERAAKAPSTEDLKREAMSVAHSIGVIFEERKRRQVSHVTELGERMAALGRALEEARREVGLDSLTRLSNRKAFDDELGRVADVASLFRQPACLVLIDADHFKSVNDSYGHAAGDEVLRQLTGCLVRTFRRRDDVVARYGGEEFAIILRETVMREAALLSERLLESVRDLSVEHAGRAIKLTVSVGVAEVQPGETSDNWLQRTDHALYEAKNAGRDRVACAHAPEPDSAA
ncbi:MAG TPA: GGDEF domain-containing protein [Polyangiaceae bacterium]|nr:GGDEF domain-containing protein [Polyangiaceae bacterium]